MSKLTEYTAATSFDSGDILIKDGTGGTKQITASDVAVEMVGLISNQNRRNTYRGKNLGTSITSDQLAEIQAGTFKDLFVGDYWVINSKTYRIADMDYWYNCGDTAFTQHHLVIVPDAALHSAKMNDTSTTVGGYVGSLMYTDNIATARETIETAFGDNLLTHREYLVNAVTSGKPSAVAWYDSDIELMNEIMVYGTRILSPGNDGTTVSSLQTINNSQLALFQLNPRMIKTRATYWLRDVVSSSRFANVNTYGYATYNNATISLGVRPVFAIG